MAQGKEKNLGLVKALTFEKEYREDGGNTAEIKGRFKHFRAVWSKMNSVMMLPNILFLVTLLPVLALYVGLMIFTPELLSARLFADGKLQYLMGNIGMGASQTGDMLVIKLNILTLNKFYYLFVGVGMIFMSIGMAGMMPIAMKSIIGDSFVTKKDKYGNDVPRGVIEFFKGIKKYWYQMLIVGVMLFVIVAGASNVVMLFIGQLWKGQAGAGEYILLILTCIITLFALMFLLHFVPTIVLYEMPLKDKMKNAAILAVQMFVPNLMILGLIAAPILLFTLTTGIFNILSICLLLVFGCPFYSLVVSNYSQYYSQNLITPVYNAKINASLSGKGKKKRKK